MVRTGNVNFSCKRLTSIEIRKSKYHIIRRVRFRWDPPEKDIWIRACYPFTKRQILDSSKLKEFADDIFKFNDDSRTFFERVENTGKRRNCS